eukprot:3213748-Prymnesium_polylepis.1
MHRWSLGRLALACCHCPPACFGASFPAARSTALCATSSATSDCVGTQIVPKWSRVQLRTMLPLTAAGDMPVRWSRMPEKPGHAPW